MVRLEAVAAPHLCGRVRCRSAHHAYDSGDTQSFCFLSAERSCTVRDRAPQWWLALAAGFYPAREPKRMGLWLKESVPISAFRSLHLSSRASDHSRLV